jgi:hypothetical protein
MFLFCGLFCFPPAVSGPRKFTQPVPHARSFRDELLLAFGHAAVSDPPGPETGRLYFLPNNPMLYQIKLQYGFIVDAGNRDEAYSKVIRRLRESPELFIADIRPAGESKNKPSLMRRFITGQ